MMVDVPRLMNSGFNSAASGNPTAWMVGHKLWYRAWHQVPAASLPDNDDELCHLAELGFDLKTWRKVKEIALRNWVRCDDGRLYHPLVAETALEAWIEKLLQRLSSGTGNAARYGHAFDPAPVNAAIDQAMALLNNLNPRSRAADKMKRRQSRAPASPVPVQAVGAPTGSPAGLPPASLEIGIGIRIEEPNGSLSSAISPTEIKQAFDDYNTMAKRCALPVARTLDAGRKTAIGKHLREDGAERWAEALAAVERSPHCRGENDRSWKADLDFICQPKSWRRLAEGFYGEGAAAPSAPAVEWPGPPTIMDEVLRHPDGKRLGGLLNLCEWAPVGNGGRVTHWASVIIDPLQKEVGARLADQGVSIVHVAARTVCGNARDNRQLDLGDVVACQDASFVKAMRRYTAMTRSHIVAAIEGAIVLSAR